MQAGAALLGLMLVITVAGCRPAASPPPPDRDPRVVEAMNLGVSLMGQYLYDDAVKAFDRAIEIAPGLTEARIDLAIALFNRNRKEDLDRAGKVLEAVLDQDPHNLRALYFQAIVLQHLGNAEAAVPGLEQVVKARPDDGAAWYLLALCKQRAGQAAEAEYLQAVRHRPYLFSAYYQLYQEALRSGQDAKAKEYLELFKTLRASPLGESIELPQYNQMGDLALARPLPALTPPPIAKSRFRLLSPSVLFTWAGASLSGGEPQSLPLGGAAIGDLDRDGRVDVVVPLGGAGSPVLLRQLTPGEFTNATPASGLATATNALAIAIGDYDNDDLPDLYLAGASSDRLFRGKGDGTFADVTAPASLSATAAPSHSALFLDADHDGDLDLLVSNTDGNRLWNNNGNGAFTNITASAGLASATGKGPGSLLALPADIDGDRDLDLILLPPAGPAQAYLNELLGRYRPADAIDPQVRGEAGGVAQDFNGDGTMDLMVLGGSPRELQLCSGDGRGQFRADTAFTRVSEAVVSWGPLRGFRVADVDLDGDLDVLCCGAEAVHLLLNDGAGRFVMQGGVWKPASGQSIVGIECVDLNGDFVPDLLTIEQGVAARVTVAYGQLTPPSNALAIRPSGIRSRDGRTRSPASGYGVRLTARAGQREQRRLVSGQSGGANQSLVPVVFGLGGASKADYLDFLWPDGVAQAEVALVAGQTHVIAELQRKVSSCPVLFAWNGMRFEFVTDFAGVGGLGYYAAPGVSTPPQVLEHVKIEPAQLKPRAGVYELRVTEPMEEVAYIDRLELLVVDHASDQAVFPDERLAISGPAPTHELLVVDEQVFPIRAFEPTGRECADALVRVDRVYAFDPPLDRRYVGFCLPHQLELDFGNQLADWRPADRVCLFINGFIEYPYSQTVYAASQSGIGWDPIRVEGDAGEGRWRTLVPDGGAPGGMARTMTIDLTGKLDSTIRRLRLTTNLEIGYDQIFLARLGPRTGVSVYTAPLTEATLRRVGFAREFSPDGRLPLVFDYEHSDATAPFHSLRGAYTRYGPVRELLLEFDDRYVLVGPGDEIALKFDAASLPAVGPGRTRSFVLVSHAYCKDMDLYTATPQTLEPLPFNGMSRYPYPPSEHYPDSEEHRAFLRTYNTRWIE